MTFRRNPRSHNQPSPPKDWMLEHCPYWNDRTRGPFGADWYKHRSRNGRPLSASQRRAFKRFRLLSNIGSYTDEYHREDKEMFDLFHELQFEAFEPRCPEYPLVEWLAVQIFYWYGPLYFAVDMTAEDWVEQLHAADERHTFSFAECEAQAAKWGYLMPDTEVAILKRIVGRVEDIPINDEPPPF